MPEMKGPIREKGNWHIGPVILLVNLGLFLVFLILGAVVLNEVKLIHQAADDSRTVAVPKIFEQQRVVINIEKLKNLGDLVVQSESPAVRLKTSQVATLLANHLRFYPHPKLQEAVRRAENSIRRTSARMTEGGGVDTPEARSRLRDEAIASWSAVRAELEEIGDTILVGATDLTTRQFSTMDAAARRVEMVIVLDRLVLLAVLAAAWLIVYRLLLRPIALTVKSLNAHQDGQSPVSLPQSAFAEIDWLFRAADEIAGARHEIELAHRATLEAQDELRRRANTDDLTRLHSRRYFFDLGGHEWNRVKRSGQALSVLMIDIDHFKSINDVHGHAVGDGVLKAVSTRLVADVRNIDVIGRLGGEEFAIVLPDIPGAVAADIAGRLHRSIARRPVRVSSQGRTVQVDVTVSIGVATMRTDDPSLDHLLARADAALYKAKNRGRNRVVQAEAGASDAAPPSDEGLLS
jgi:diguanylate cyclase (GGDEF)-like protein